MKTKIKNDNLNFLIKKSILLFVIIFSLFSCSNDDEPTVYPEENPLSGYLTLAEFTTNSEVINAGISSEFGIEFTPLVKGKINSLTVNIPDTNPTLIVTIWDATTKTVLRTEVINVTISNSNITKTIGSLSLEKNKKYAITMNSKDYHNRKRPDNSSISYPISSGNIRVEGYGWTNSNIQIYPENFEFNYYGGDLTFNFQQTE
ncbi:MAG: DUF4082 domain-containing protein [Flavobacterium sp.]|nr:DUF4082 domain-containing protein [Flavobacterium sp.]